MQFDISLETIASVVAVAISALTWWRHRRVPKVIARKPYAGGDAVILENFGGRPAYKVTATARQRRLDRPSPRTETWEDHWLPVERLDPGAQYGLPMLRIGRADPTHFVTVRWRRVPWFPFWPSVTTRTYHLSPIGDEPRPQLRARDLQGML